MPDPVKLLGSIDQRPSGRWRYRVTVGGKSSRDTYATEAEARAVQLAVSLAATQPQSKTLADYFPVYLDWRETVQKTADMASARSLWRRHISPALIAKMALREIRRSDVEAWAERLTGSVQTRKHALHLMSRCFDRAKRERIIGENPAIGVHIEGKDPDVWTYLSASEQHRLMTDERIPEPERLAIAFAIGTGLRLSEQWSLQLCDVCADGDDPHVIVRWGGRGKPPKNGKPRRVPLFGWVAVVVKRQLELMPSVLKSPSGKKVYRNEHGLLWPSARGQYRRGKKPHRKWSGWLKLLGIRGVTGHPVVWHALRHTCASMLVSGAWGRRWTLQEVAEMLGHDDTETTGRYAHLAEGTITRAAQETLGVPSMSRDLSNTARHTGFEPVAFSSGGLRGNVSGREVTPQGTPDRTALALAVVRLAAAGDGRVVAAALRLAEAVLAEAVEDRAAG